jgi:ABC-type lipoprotein release transport system permease subunit
MRVVGASNSLVRGPFVIDGMLCGAIAAIASLILIAPIIYFVSPYLDVFIPGLNLFQYFYTEPRQASPLRTGFRRRHRRPFQLHRGQAVLEELGLS